MKDKVNVAVVGATGMVGESMLAILAERGFPVGNLYALASERSRGKTVEFAQGEPVIRPQGVLVELEAAPGDLQGLVPLFPSPLFEKEPPE